MANETQSETELNNILEKIENLEHPEEINKIIKQTGLSLFHDLSDKTINISEKTIEHIWDIYNRLNDYIWWGRLTAKINEITAQLAPWWLPPKATERPQLRKQLQELTAIRNSTTPHIQRRLSEYSALNTIANKFQANINTNIPEQTITPWAGTNINLDNIFLWWTRTNTDTNANYEYQFVDENWTKLQRDTHNRLQVKVKTSNWEQIIWVSWLRFNNVAPFDLIINNLQIDPPDVILLEPLKINIKWNYPNIRHTFLRWWDTGINISHTKSLNINLTSWTTIWEDRTRRINALNNVESSPPNRNVRNGIYWEYGRKYKEISRKILFNIIEKNNNSAEYKKLTERQKDILRDDMQNIQIGTTWILDIITPNAINNNWTPNNANIDTIYTEYSNFIADKSFNQNITRSSDIFESYLAMHQPELLEQFFQERVNNYINNNANANIVREIKTTYTNFMNWLRSWPIDNNTDQIIRWSIKNKLIDNINSPFRPRDRNYLRFFSWKESTSNQEEVEIMTWEWIEKFNYNLSCKVESAKKVSIEFKIADQIHSISAWTPSKLIKKILRYNPIEQWKLRCHVAYSFIKSLVNLAHQSDISLKMSTWKNKTSEIKVDENKNIILETINDNWTRRITNPIFKEDLFKNTAIYNTSWEIRSLRTGIETVTKYFEKTMNRVHIAYTDASERRALWLVKWRMRTNIPTSAFLHPIRTLWNLWTKQRFTIEDISVPWTDVSISWKNWKRTVSKEKIWMNKNWEEISWKWKNNNLWLIINKRHNRNRVFEWIERDIVATAYEEIIKQLRQNSKIARTTFRAYDPLTRRMYILDEQGKFGYIPKKNRKKSRTRRNFGFMRQSPTMIQLTNEREINEVKKNPLVMARFTKAMWKRMLFAQPIR